MSWSIDVSFILHMLMNFKSILSTEFSTWNSSSKDLTWMSLWVQKWCSESGLTWDIWSMIIWMSLWESFSSVSSGSRIQRIVCFWNIHWIKSESLKIEINNKNWKKTYPVELIVYFLSSKCAWWRTSLLCSVILLDNFWSE